MILKAISRAVKNMSTSSAPEFVPHEWETARNNIIRDLKEQGYVVNFASVPFDKQMQPVSPGSEAGTRIIVAPPGTMFGGSAKNPFGKLSGLLDAGGPFMVHPNIAGNEAVMRALKRYRQAKPKLAKPVALQALDISSS